MQFVDTENPGPSTPASMLIRGSDDPIRELMSALNGGSQVQILNVAPSGNSMTLIFFDSAVNILTQTTSQLTTVANLTGAIMDEKCQLAILPSFLLNDAESGPLQPGLFRAQQMKAAERPPCDYRKLQAVKTRFQSLLDNMGSVGSVSGLRAIRNRIDILLASSAWTDCQAVLEAAMTSGLAAIDVANSIDCAAKAGTLEFATDPCCNKTLSFTQCCAPRTVKRQINRMTGINSVFLARSCDVTSSTIGSLLSVLQSYISDKESLADPNTGCIASSLKSLRSNSRDVGELWQELTSFNSVFFFVFPFNCIS